MVSHPRNEFLRRVSSNSDSKLSSRVERPHSLVYRMPKTTPSKRNIHKNNEHIFPILENRQGVLILEFDEFLSKEPSFQSEESKNIIRNLI